MLDLKSQYYYFNYGIIKTYIIYNIYVKVYNRSSRTLTVIGDSQSPKIVVYFAKMDLKYSGIHIPVYDEIYN